MSYGRVNSRGRAGAARGGYRVILVDSTPATITTDRGLAGATDIELINSECA
jgi:carbamoylphosphate synthase large subunit